MQKTLYQAADAGDSLSDSGCRRLYQTEDEGDARDFLLDSRCRSISIRQRMQEILHQTADAGDIYQTADAGVSP